jgi:hypothetical protein
MHPIPIGQRFKVLLQDNYLGTTTQKEYSLDDFEKLLNSRPGTLGKFTVEKDVILSEKFSPAVTLPKGAKVVSAAYQLHQAPTAGEELQFGTEDNPSLIGSGGFDKPFAEKAPDSAELDKDQELGFSISGLKDNEKAQGMVHVIVQYEMFNEWPNVPNSDEEAHIRSGIVNPDNVERVAKEQRETDKRVQDIGEHARKQEGGSGVGRTTKEATAAQPGGQKASATNPNPQPGQQGPAATATAGS